MHGAWADSSSWDGEIGRLRADGYPVVAPANPLRSLGGDLMAVTQRPVTLTALSQKSGAPAWKRVPSWYLAGRQDKSIPPATQTFMARRAHSHTVEIEASHASLVSHPAAVTNLILAAAHTVAK